MENDRDSLVNRVELIEAQPLADRADMFDQVHNELLQELQRSDTAAHAAGDAQDTRGRA